MELLELIKQISVDAVETGKPVNAITGKVTSLSPLRVQVSMKLELEKQLIVTDRINDLITGYYLGNSTSMFLTSATTSARGLTPGSYKKLSVGDTVLLLRVQGGQSFVVMDKVV